MKSKKAFTFTQFLFFTLLVVMASCNPAGGEKKSQVEIKTDGIFTEPTVNFLNGNDLGEFLVGSDTVIVPVRITNKSKHAWFNMKFDLENNSDGFFYRKNEEDADPGYPGFGGTCSSTLAAGSQCMVYLQYEPTKAGDFVQKVNLDYSNVVSPESIEFEMYALSGEAASLVFIDDVAVYNHGVVEQTEPPTIHTDITIKNAGGLSAKNMSFQIIKDSPLDPDLAGFNITQNDCPSNLRPKETCNVRITYIPLNNGDFDAEISYESNFRTTYVNDPFGTLAFLNGYWSSLSTKIQGVFQTNLPMTEFLTPDGDNPIVGNVLTKSVKVTNIGYREGILLEAVIKNPTYGTGPSDEWAICTKPLIAGDFMECKTPLGAPIGVADLFPWKMKDTSECMEEDTAGIVGDNAVGDSCFFELFFHPSTKLAYNANHSYNGTTIEFKYDSRWKGNTTIYQPEFFQLFGTAIGAGRIAVDSFIYNSNPLTVDTTGTLVSTEDTFGSYDAGRVALVTSPTYFTPFIFRVKNIGNSPATITSIITKKTLAEQNDITIGALDTNVNEFFTTLSSSCFASELQPGQVCAMQGRFAPVHQGSEPANDNLAFDNIVGPDKWKAFDFIYTDGTKCEDIGTCEIDDIQDRPERIAQGRFTQALVAKGYLAYHSSRPLADGKYGVTLEENGMAQVQIKMINVGTAGIPYIKLRQYNPLAPSTNIPHENPEDDYELIPHDHMLENWPMSVVATPAAWLTANPGWIDCEPLVDRRHIIGSDTFVVDTYEFNRVGTALAAHGTYPAPLPGWELPSLGRCALTIQYQMPYPQYKSKSISNVYNAGGTGSETGQPKNYRHAEYRVDKLGGNELDLWPADIWLNMNWPEIVSFEYFDGDFVGRGPTDPDPSDLDQYGDLHLIAAGDPTKDDTYELAVDFRAISIITPVNPLPHSSGILYRPGFTLPATSGDTNDEWYEASFVMPENWDYTNWAVTGTNYNPGIAAYTAKAVVKAAHDPAYEYTYHMGTFPINLGPYAGSLGYTNKTNNGVNDLSLDWDSVDGSHPIQFNGGAPMVSLNLSGNTVRQTVFSFTPTVAGTFSRIITYSYNNGVETVTKKVKVVADAVDGDYAHIEFDEEDYTVTYDPVGGAAEVLSGNRVGITSHINKINSPTVDSTITTVRRGNIDADVTIYAKKRLYLKNTTVGQNIKNITAFWRTSVATSSPDNNMANIGVATAVLDTECTDPGTDLPFGSECIIDLTYTPFNPSNTNYRVLTINYEILPGQVLQKNVYFGITPLDPANVTVPSLSYEPTFDQNLVPRSSYPLNWGTVTLQNYPETVPADKVITVQNNSTLAASFIKQWQCYQEELNPANNGGSSCITDINNDTIDEFVPGNEVTTQDVGPTGSPVLIYSKFGVEVRANHECFYGDDTYAGDASDDSKGFTNSVSIACQLRFRYRADESYVMENIDSPSSMVRLSYWDYERNSFYSKLFFHPKGFVKPNAVNSGNFNNVTSDYGGTIYVEWDAMTDNPYPGNPLWGPITGYKMFGSTSENSFSGNKIYTTQSLVDAAADTTDLFMTITTGTIVGLNISPGTFYYFKLAAKRLINGKNYYVDSGMPTLKVLSPPVGSVYDYDGDFIVDKGFNAELKTWSQSKTYCLANQFNLTDSGLPEPKTKRLTTTAIHNWIKADPSRSDYTYYAVPHWLQDNPTNISPIYNGCQAYDPANQTGVCQDYPLGETPEAWLTYFKSCGDSSCDNLYKVYGTINATNEVFYTDDPDMTFYQRCYSPL